MHADYAARILLFLFQKFFFVFFLCIDVHIFYTSWNQREPLFSCCRIWGIALFYPLIHLRYQSNIVIKPEEDTMSNRV